HDGVVFPRLGGGAVTCPAPEVDDGLTSHVNHDRCAELGTGGDVVTEGLADRVELRGTVAADRVGCHWMRRSIPAQALSRRTNFWIFPVPVFGRSPKVTVFGALYLASRCFTCSMISASVADAPSLRVT